MSELFNLLNLRPWKTEERQKYDDKSVIESIKKDPSACQKIYKFPYVHFNQKVYPLLPAVTLGASSEVVALILCHCPLHAIEECDSEGRSSFTHSCNNRSVSVIKILIESAVSVKNLSSKMETNPFDLLLECNPPLDIVKLFVKKFKIDIEHNHLRSLCFNGGSIEVLEYLINKRPNTLLTCPGSLLSSVCGPFGDKYGNQLKLIQYISQISPKCWMASTDQYTPLQTACSHKETNPKTIRLLLELYPSSVCEIDYYKRTPLDTAKLFSSREVYDLMRDVTYLYRTVNNDPTDACSIIYADPQLLNETLLEFISVSWMWGIMLTLDVHPDLVHWLNLETALIPHVLERCKRKGKGVRRPLNFVFVVMKSWAQK